MEFDVYEQPSQWLYIVIYYVQYMAIYQRYYMAM